MSDRDRETIQRIADDMQRQDFDHVWIVGADDKITDAPGGIYAPDVVNDPSGDVEIQSSDWHALTGMTGQYGYSGAVMHPSEFIGVGVAETVLWHVDSAREDGETLAWAVVTVDDSDDDGPIGWAVVYRKI